MMTAVTLSGHQKPAVVPCQLLISFLPLMFDVSLISVGHQMGIFWAPHLLILQLAGSREEYSLVFRSLCSLRSKRGSALRQTPLSQSSMPGGPGRPAASSPLRTEPSGPGTAPAATETDAQLPPQSSSSADMRHAAEAIFALQSASSGAREDTGRTQDVGTALARKPQSPSHLPPPPIQPSVQPSSAGHHQSGGAGSSEIGGSNVALGVVKAPEKAVCSNDTKYVSPEHIKESTGSDGIGSLPPMSKPVSENNSAPTAPGPLPKYETDHPASLLPPTSTLPPGSASGYRINTPDGMDEMAKKFEAQAAKAQRTREARAPRTESLQQNNHPVIQYRSESRLPESVLPSSAANENSLHGANGASWGLPSAVAPAKKLSPRLPGKEVLRVSGEEAAGPSLEPPVSLPGDTGRPSEASVMRSGPSVPAVHLSNPPYAGERAVASMSLHPQAPGVEHAPNRHNRKMSSMPGAAPSNDAASAEGARIESQQPTLKVVSELLPSAAPGPPARDARGAPGDQKIAAGQASAVRPSAYDGLPQGRAYQRPKRPKRVASSAKRWADAAERFRKSLPPVKVYMEDRRAVPFRDMRGWIDKLANADDHDLVKKWDTLFNSLVPSDTIDGGDEEICRFILQYVVTDQVDPNDSSIRQSRQAVNNAIKRELECPFELRNLARGYTFRDLFRRKCRERTLAGMPELPLAPPRVPGKPTAAGPQPPAGRVPLISVVAPSGTGLAGAGSGDTKPCSPNRAGASKLAGTGANVDKVPVGSVPGPNGSSLTPQVGETSEQNGNHRPVLRQVPASGAKTREEIMVEEMKRLLSEKTVLCAGPSAMRGCMQWWLLLDRHEDGYHPVELFQELLSARRLGDLFRLLFDYRWIRAHVTWPGWPTRLHGLQSLARDGYLKVLQDLRTKTGHGDHVYDDLGFDSWDLESLRLIYTALVMMVPLYETKIPTGGPKSHQLATQLYGRLMGRCMRLVNRFPHLNLLLRSIRRHGSEDGVWLRPLNSIGFDEPMTDVVRTMRADDATVVAISLDGNYVAVAGGPRSRFDVMKSMGYSIYVWKVGDDEPRMLPEGHDREINCLAISPCGTYLVGSAAGTSKGSVKVWRDWKPGPSELSESEHAPYSLAQQTSFVSSLVISADSKILGVAFQKKEIKTWRFVDGAAPVPDRVVSVRDVAYITNIALSADGRYFAFVCDEHYVGREPAPAVDGDTEEATYSTFLWSFGNEPGEEVEIARLPDNPIVRESGERLVPARTAPPPVTPAQIARNTSLVLSVQFLYSDESSVCLATAGTEARRDTGRGYVSVWSIEKNRREPGANSWTAKCSVKLSEMNVVGTVSSLSCPPVEYRPGSPSSTEVKTMFSSSDDGLVLAWRRNTEAYVEARSQQLVRESICPAERIAHMWRDVRPVAIGSGTRLPTFEWSNRGTALGHAASIPVTTRVSVSRNAERVATVSSDRSLLHVWDVKEYLGETLSMWQSHGVYKSILPSYLPSQYVPIDSLDNEGTLYDYFQAQLGAETFQTRHFDTQVQTRTSDCVEVDVPPLGTDRKSYNPRECETLVLFFDKPVARGDPHGRGFVAGGAYKQAPAGLRSRQAMDELAPRRGLTVRFADEHVAFFELEEPTKVGGMSGKRKRLEMDGAGGGGSRDATKKLRASSDRVQTTASLSEYTSSSVPLKGVGGASFAPPT